MAYALSNEICVICKEPESENDKLRIPSTGLQQIINYSEIFELAELNKTLLESCKEHSEKSVNVNIHVSCQKYIGNEIRKKKRKGSAVMPSGSRSKAKRRSHEPSTFDWNIHCLFCGKVINMDTKHPNRANASFSCAETMEHRTKLLTYCENRDDEAAEVVKRRLLSCSDLPAVEARYHQRCRLDFKFPSNKESTENECRKGRPKSEIQMANFSKLCDWLELEGELYSVRELYKKMEELSRTEGDVYADERYLKQQLKQKYKDSIFFAEIDGKADIVCFKDIASNIINDEWYSNRKSDPLDESRRIITTAAKIIVGELRATRYDLESYPRNEDISDLQKNINWLPIHLRLLMEHLIKNPLKQASIGQALVHAIKPRSSLPPVLFGIGVEMDHLFGSKWLLSELNRLGFSLNYKEITRYKQSVVCNEDINMFIKHALKGCFGQWSADNVDIQVCTLDGSGNLHGMGVVLSSTGLHANASSLKLPLIPRQKLQSIQDVVKNKGIPIIPYFPPDISGLSKIKLKPIHSILLQRDAYSDLNMDLLWHALHFVPKLAEDHPGWTGFMTDISKGTYPGKSVVNMLPIIDLDPTDMSCIYSTLVFIIKQAEELQISTPILTFDQPLWLKASEISHALDFKIVLILGGFHTLMSFAGSVGSIMSGSGIADVLKTVYGKVVVNHILSGKAIARSLRAHFMLQAVLTNKLMSNFLPTKVESVSSETRECAEIDEVGDIIDATEEYTAENDVFEYEGKDKEGVTYPDVEVLEISAVEKIECLFDAIKEDYGHGLTEMEKSIEFNKIKINLQNLKQHISKASRTSKLWIHYIRYVEIIKKFIRAERTGNWTLHLQTVSEMINLFAASGHIHYAKSARLYLQQMLELETNYPWVYDNFLNCGYHTVRRTDRFWAGLWTDLIIEQVMMRSLKSRGGLSGGRGVTESVRMMWIHSMHRCAGIHNAMSDLTGMQHRTSEQHVELCATRIKRDVSDMKKFDLWFQIHDPFDPDVPSLRSLSSGLAAKESDNINCDTAEEVGLNIQKKMDGITFEEVTISRNDHARTLDILQEGVVINDKVVHIDPLILFSRASTLIERQDSQTQLDSFSHEFTPEPTALFKNGLMRKPQKQELRNSIIEQDQRVQKPEASFCVLDGGAALHRSPWALQMSYSELADQFVYEIASKYSCFKEIHIVFDGYNDQSSTKTDEHEGRRRTGKVASNVIISEAGDTIVTSKKDEFLQNKHNKGQLIHLLMNRLSAAGIKTSQSEGDADTLIVKTALVAANRQKPTVVVSADTDILMLLLYHHQPSMADIFFQTSRKIPVVPEKGASKAAIKRATSKSKQKPIPMWWNIRTLTSISQDERRYILFVHAWGGCDTTSAIHGKGKLSIFNLLKKSSFKLYVEPFTNDDSTADEIGDAGSRIMLTMYKGKEGDCEAVLRHASWLQMILSTKKLSPDRLCPTTRAVYFHSLRVYLQVRKWTTLNEKCLNPCHWGWKREVNGLKPIKTDKTPAPDYILNVVRCNCSISAKNPCRNMNCSCKKHGLLCVKACGHCRGMSCNNVSLAHVEDDSDCEVIEELNYETSF